MNNNNYYAEYHEDESTNVKFRASATTLSLVKSFLWMFVGAMITLVVGLLCSKVVNDIILSGSGFKSTMFLVVSIVSMVLQVVLCFSINRNALMHANFAKALGGFLLYSALTGVSFSCIFIYFDIGVLYQVFGGVALYFLLLAGITYMFRNKVHKMANFAYIGLITLLICSVIESLYVLFFFNPVSHVSTTLMLTISIIGLVVFTLLTLVDIKGVYHVIDYSANQNCASIAGAFTLYLDFLNILTYVLRLVLIFGRNSSNSD